MVNLEACTIHVRVFHDLQDSWWRCESSEPRSLQTAFLSSSNRVVCDFRNGFHKN